MNGAVHSASIATSISIGISLLAGLFSVLVAMRSRDGAPVNRDTAVSVLFGTAIVLIVLNGIAAALIAVGGMTYAGVVQVALLLTAGFAVVGMVFGLLRSLPSGRALKTPST